MVVDLVVCWRCCLFHLSSPGPHGGQVRSMVLGEITAPGVVPSCQAHLWGWELEHNHPHLRSHCLQPTIFKRAFLCLFILTGEHLLRLGYFLFSSESCTPPSPPRHHPQTVQPNHSDALLPSTLENSLRVIFRERREKAFMFSWDYYGEKKLLTYKVITEKIP